MPTSLTQATAADTCPANRYKGLQIPTLGIKILEVSSTKMRRCTVTGSPSNSQTSQVTENRIVFPHIRMLAIQIRSPINHNWKHCQV